jgi:hypothetical protein
MLHPLIIELHPIILYWKRVHRTAIPIQAYGLFCIIVINESALCECIVERKVSGNVVSHQIGILGVMIT